MERRGKPKWRRLGTELRVLRRRAQMTQAGLAPYARVVPAQISAWENGKRGMTHAQARRLDQALNANGWFERAYEKANTPDSLPIWYEQVPEIEQRVSELREYQCQLVPGLIQTAEYAKATIRDALPWASDDEVDQMVDARMARQDILEKGHSPLVSMVVEEFVLSRVIGDERTQAAQLDCVLDLVQRGKIRFQVVPSDVRHHHGTAGPFRIYTFPDNPPLASAEYAAGEVLMEDQEVVQRCMTTFGFLQAEALSMEASVELLRKVRKSIDG
ncbi:MULTISPECIES: helix-turn-helix domain-containing protein [Nocardiopsis]|uniref:HTH cro/C1-type domain-containing protein n=1 Tax=Nocardiopsis sinuspersici TaxID=501010 RepID=A0A1V3C682_9ACTN|nr:MULTISPECIES: helix-turn-helix transcriptional regulator [Nocardiopsis]OOC55989.1 hypothetical protein NOSIN_20890 [Nocardiopsis sinuspersici]